MVVYRPNRPTLNLHAMHRLQMHHDMLNDQIGKGIDATIKSFNRGVLVVHITEGNIDDVKLANSDGQGFFVIVDDTKPAIPVSSTRISPFVANLEMQTAAICNVDLGCLSIDRHQP